MNNFPLISISNLHAVDRRGVAPGGRCREQADWPEELALAFSLYGLLVLAVVLWARFDSGSSEVMQFRRRTPGYRPSAPSMLWGWTGWDC